MAGLKRRRRVEGWAVNLSESGGEADNSSLRQRLADNNKLWAFSMVAIVLITCFLFFESKQGASKDESNFTDKYQATSNTPYLDEAHNKFVSAFKTYKSSGFTVLDASFVGPGSLQVVVPGDVSADDIEYMANLIGMKALHSLKERIVVNVYFNKASGIRPDAVASFNPKQNGFIVKFKDSGGTTVE